MFRDYNNVAQDPDFSQVNQACSFIHSEELEKSDRRMLVSLLYQVVELDLSAVVPCCSGPKRPQDRIPVSEMKSDFDTCLGAKVGSSRPTFHTHLPYNELIIKMNEEIKTLTQPEESIMCWTL